MNYTESFFSNDVTADILGNKENDKENELDDEEPSVKEKLIDISKYNFDFTKDINNIIEISELSFPLIKEKVMKLPNLNPTLAKLLALKNSKVYPKEDLTTIDTSKPFDINILIDAENVDGYTGQAIIKVTIKKTKVLINELKNIHGKTELNRGKIGTRETTDFANNLSDVFNYYGQNDIKFIVEEWYAFYLL